MSPSFAVTTGARRSRTLSLPFPSSRSAVPLPGGEMTSRGTASRFLTAVLHNGVGRYVRQLQRLQVVFSPAAPDARGAR